MANCVFLFNFDRNILSMKTIFIKTNDKNKNKILIVITNDTLIGTLYSLAMSSKKSSQSFLAQRENKNNMNQNNTRKEKKIYTHFKSINCG